MKIKTLFFLLIFSGVFLGYFFYPKPYFSRLDIRYTSASIPLTNIKIEDKKYFVKIDLGSKTPLVLTKKSLANLKKIEKEKIKWRDFKGNKYRANSYLLLSKIELGDILLKNIIVRESSEAFSKNTTIKGNPSPEVEVIGRSVFTKFKVLLNFKNDKIFISNDIKKLKDSGFDISSFIKVPCKMERAGLVIEFETDLGIKRLLIDTGFSISALRDSKEIPDKKEKLELPIYRSKKFKTKNIDFGPLDLFLLDITPELHEIDGVLGMDFLKDHTMYIDFPNRVVYISKE